MGDVVSSKLFIDFKKSNTEGIRRGESMSDIMRRAVASTKMVNAMQKNGVPTLACDVYSAKVAESGLGADVWCDYTSVGRAGTFSPLAESNGDSENHHD
jgi:hypothetical protein